MSMLDGVEKKALFDRLIKDIEKLLKEPDARMMRDKKLLAICKLLKDNVKYYNWVGFYLLHPKKMNRLVIGPYVGAPTEHVDIAFGQGICGQAAVKGETFVVPNVAKESNYLSCNPDVKSEIVVVIAKDGQVVGEIDIDSHELAPFSSEDRRFLEHISFMVRELF
jgi:GAF domain-containing protein